MPDLLFTDQHILANDETWQHRVQQSSLSAAFDLLQEDHAARDYQEAKARQLLAQEIIRWPDRHTNRISAILAAQVPDTLVETDGSAVTVNDVTDAQLLGFVTDNWSKLAGVGSDLPDLS